jgi:membrane associated rhomboid family serine protease
MLPLGDTERTSITPIATYTLIALNVAMYLIQVSKGEEFTTAYAATPWEITHNADIDRPILLSLREENRRPILPVLREELPETIVIPQEPIPIPVWLTLFTAMFMHGGPLHLAGNMLYLWIFGDNVEEVLGSLRFILIYLACGLVASLSQILVNPNSFIPTLGASGAIAGVMGMYLVWFPFHRIRVLILYFIAEVPALIVIGLWIVLQLTSGLGSLGDLGHVGGVAYLAHAGGALCGVLVGFLYRDEVLRRHARIRYSRAPRYTLPY